MTCADTVLAVVAGKFLFEAALLIAVLVCAGLIWLAVYLVTRGKR